MKSRAEVLVGLVVASEHVVQNGQHQVSPYPLLLAVSAGAGPRPRRQNASQAVPVAVSLHGPLQLLLGHVGVHLTVLGRRPLWCGGTQLQLTRRFFKIIAINIRALNGSSPDLRRVV